MRARTFFVAVAALCLIIPGLISVGLLFAALQQQPLVASDRSLTHDDVARLKRLLKQHDPRRAHSGTSRQVSLLERDVNLLLKYATANDSRFRAKLALAANIAQLDYTLVMPDNPLGKYLNLGLALREISGQLQIWRVSFGKLEVPGVITAPFRVVAHHLLQRQAPLLMRASQAIETVALGNKRLFIRYRWYPALANQLEQAGRTWLIPPGDQERLLSYYRTIGRLAQSEPFDASLLSVLEPLFAMAARRSSGSGADPHEEHRALLLALGIAMSGASINPFLEGHEHVRGTGRLGFTLHGRVDLARHFAISAALAVVGGEAFADTVGVFKELDDSRSGSGFSFPDLLADRAGVELADAALGSQARQLQNYLATPRSEGVIIPSIDDLPEGLMELEFTARYRSLDDEAYGHIKSDIEERIANCPLHQALN